MSEQPPERGAIYLEWWRANHRDHGGDAATFARLRRCASPDQALVHSVTMQLVDRMSVRSKRQAAIAGAIAIVLAHVREHQEDRIFPRQLGLLTADQPALSPLR
ncbi:MAG: type I-E CRISPR-associated protein Cse2/CasB, partial [Pseudomonadota bacterium]